MFRPKLLAAKRAGVSCQQVGQHVPMLVALRRDSVQNFAGKRILPEGWRRQKACNDFRGKGSIASGFTTRNSKFGSDTRDRAGGRLRVTPSFAAARFAHPHVPHTFAGKRQHCCHRQETSSEPTTAGCSAGRRYGMGGRRASMCCHPSRVRRQPPDMSSVATAGAVASLAKPREDEHGDDEPTKPAHGETSEELT